MPASPRVEVTELLRYALLALLAFCVFVLWPCAPARAGGGSADEGSCEIACPSAAMNADAQCIATADAPP